MVITQDTVIMLSIFLMLFTCLTAVGEGKSNITDSYYHIGCYKEDHNNRTLPVLLANNSQSSLSNEDKVRRCAKLTYAAGYKAFGVQNNGECWSGTKAGSTYDIHGEDSSCNNGTGGVKTNDVYFLELGFVHAGCFKEDPNNRAMPMSVAMDNRSGSTILRRCARASWRMGFTKAFGLVNGGECWSGINASLTYNKHGVSNKCSDLTGGPLAIDVYLFLKTTVPTATAPQVTIPPTTVESKVYKQIDYNHIGCFKDTSYRAMPEFIGKWGGLGKPLIEKCAVVSRNKGYKAFGIQYGSECWSGVNASLTYSKYGKATNCKNGIGGSWAIDVYFFYIIYVPNLDVNIAPNIKPGLIVAHFTANHKDTSLVIPPLTYTITGVTTMRANAEIDGTGVIDSCGFKSVSNSSFPFCIYKSQGIVVVSKNLSCSEGDTFVISINVTDSGNDTIEKTVNPNGKVTIVCKEECKNTSSLYENATKTCSTRSNLSFQLNDTKTKAINTRGIYAIYGLRIFDIKRDTSTCYLKFNISYNSEEVSWDDVENQTNMAHTLDYPIIITGPVISITLLSNGCNTSSASFTLVFVHDHPEECKISWTCLDAVFYWKNSLFLTGCESDPYNLRMRYGHCVEKPIITTRPQPWRGRSGTNFILSCVVQKTIPASITWYRGENEINNITNEINNITIDVNDQGYYWCKADNRYGTVRSGKVILVVTDYFTSLISFRKEPNQDPCQSCEQIKQYLKYKDMSREYKKRGCSNSNRNNKPDKVECVIYGRKTKVHEDVNSYYNNLANILTEGAKIGDLKIFWETISVKDTEICRKGTTGKHYFKGYFTWDAVGIGDTRTVSCPLGPDGSSATRTCGGNFNTGAEWNTPDDESCEYNSQKTKSLYELSKIKLSSSNAKEIARDFTKLFKSGSAKDLSEADAALAADMVAKIVAIDDQLNETAGPIVEVIDFVMEMLKSYLQGNTCTSIIRSLDKLVEKIPLDEGTTSRVLKRTNLAIQASEVTRSTFKGFTFGIKKNKADGHSGPSVTSDGDHSSIFVKLPNTILQNSKKTSNRIGFIYYANNKLFQSNPQDGRGQLLISNEVISSSVYNESIQNLTDPVSVAFPKLRDNDGNPGSPTSCVFWDVSKRQWSSLGCTLHKRGDIIGNRVECHCNHLTSFSVVFAFGSGKCLMLSNFKNKKISKVDSNIC